MIQVLIYYYSRDEYQLFYRDGNQTADNAISVGYVAPSVTPFLNTNPAFRLYRVNAETFEVMDSITYVADLDQADQWVTGPVNINVSVKERVQDAYMDYVRIGMSNIRLVKHINHRMHPWKRAPR